MRPTSQGQPIAFIETRIDSHPILWIIQPVRIIPTAARIAGIPQLTPAFFKSSVFSGGDFCAGE